jgi:hypothetical protein
MRERRHLAADLRRRVVAVERRGERRQREGRDGVALRFGAADPGAQGVQFHGRTVRQARTQLNRRRMLQ